MECTMKPGILLLLIVIMASIPGSRGNACDYVAKSRAAGTYEPVLVKVNAYDQNGHGPEEKEIPFCLIKDGQECFPNNYYITEKGSKINELAEMEEHMKLYLPGEKNRVFGIGQINSHWAEVADSDGSRRFRSFSCKSGFCRRDYFFGEPKAGTCVDDTCKPPSCTRVHSIDWISFLELQDQIYYKKEYKAWLKERKKAYERNLQSLLKNVNCKYLSRQDKRDVPATANNDFLTSGDPVTYTIPTVTASLARIEIEKGGGEFMIGICTIRDGDQCFPNTEDEFMALKGHLETAHVFPEFGYPEPEPDSEKLPKPAKDDKSTPPIKLKSWNCASGVCDSESLKCKGKKYDEERVSRVWKLYEYKMHSKGVRNTGFISLFLVIKLTVVLNLG